MFDTRLPLLSSMILGKVFNHCGPQFANMIKGNNNIPASKHCCESCTCMWLEQCMDRAITWDSLRSGVNVEWMLGRLYGL